MRDLIKYAADRGLTVHAAHLPEGYLGFYEAEPKRIWFDIGLTPAETRSVIAHELGHEHYGHLCDSSRNEREADAFAATLLIDPHEFAMLEQIDPSVESLADEFGVTPDVIRDYRRYCLRRIGERVYLKRSRDRERRIA